MQKNIVENLTLIHVTISHYIGNRDELPQFDREYLQNTKMNIIPNGEKFKAYPLGPGIMQGQPLSPLCLNITLDIIANTVRQGKEITDTD